MNTKRMSMELEFTKTYKRYKNSHPGIREIMCIKAQYPYILREIRENDAFAGRVDYGSVGFSIQGGGFMFFCNDYEIKAEILKAEPGSEYRAQLEDMLEFWLKENSTFKIRQAFPDEMSKVLFSDNWMGEPGIGFPLYRIGGPYLDFQKLLTLGLPGMRDLVERHRIRALADGSDYKLFEAMHMALELISDVSLYYSRQAREKASTEKNENRKKELLELGDTLQRITEEKPSTLKEAMQLVWLYIIISEVRNYGRMDIYLGDFYASDIAAGNLTEEEALNLVKRLWNMIADRKTTFDGRVVIGGKGRKNEKNADLFALAALEASRTVEEIEPQLSLRFYNGMDRKLMDKALASIGEGRTYPILYNDDVNVPAVQKAFDVTREEAEQYVPFGCGEYVLDHMSIGTPSGVINLLKALEVALHNGKDPISGKMIGLQTGDFVNFETFDDLLSAYKEQVTNYVDALADQEELEYRFAGENASFLFLSMLYDDCIERGKGIFSGGIKYLGGTLETYGNTNTSDSLAAIKHLVYDKKLISREDLLKALDKNFDEYPMEHRLMKDAPKYGNDNEYADGMMLAVHDHICNTIRDQRIRTGLHSYLAVIINNQANTIMGRWTSASADGRKSGEPMANANGPSGGSDKKGITAFLNSITKIDPSIHAGAVQNMKFSRDMFTGSRKNVEALLQTYFDNGGTQAMITVVNRDDLERALVEPEKFQHVFVRVGGFSARFVELAPDVQKEVLSRTIY